MSLSPGIKWFTKFFIYSLVLVILAIAAFTFLQFRAEKRANNFCSSVKIGDRIEHVLQTADTAGAIGVRRGWINQPDSSKTLIAKFTGLDPMYGYSCTIKANNGVVLSKDFNVFDL